MTFDEETAKYYTLDLNYTGDLIFIEASLMDVY